MIDISQIHEKLQLRVTTSKNSLIKHAIINLKDPIPEDKVSNYLNNLKEIIRLQVDKDIPVFTISINQDLKPDILISLMADIEKISNENKIRVTVFGKWYDFRGDLVGVLKNISLNTKDYDKYFLNLCINYNGQEEIFDACRVMLIKAHEDKTFQNLSINSIKDNLYSSYFVPPDIIVESERKFSGTFLWDSQGAKIKCLDKKAFNVNKMDINRILDEYGKGGEK